LGVNHIVPCISAEIYGIRHVMFCYEWLSDLIYSPHNFSMNER
jgi:hypothetical protein